MKEASEPSKPVLGKRPDYQGLLDQLETRIERDVTRPGTLDVLSLRLFALHRQRSRLGHVTGVDERVSATGQHIETEPLVAAEVTARPSAPSAVRSSTPSAVSWKMANNRLQSWLGRRKNG